MNDLHLKRYGMNTFQEYDMSLQIGIFVGCKQCSGRWKAVEIECANRGPLSEASRKKCDQSTFKVCFEVFKPEQYCNWSFGFNVRYFDSFNMAHYFKLMEIF